MNISNTPLFKWNDHVVMTDSHYKKELSNKNRKFTFRFIFLNIFINIPLEQFVPVKPAVHAHEYPPISSFVHVAPLRQGSFFWQGSGHF